MRAYNKRARELGKPRSSLQRYSGPSQLFNPELYATPAPLDSASEHGVSEGQGAKSLGAGSAADADVDKGESEGKGMDCERELPPHTASDRSAVADDGDAAG